MSYIDTHRFNAAFLANRLDRLADLITAQGAAILHRAGLHAPPRTISLLLLVGDREQISAADAAKLLHQPHQLVTQRADILVSLSLIARADDPVDGRRKTLTLTPKGRAQYQILQICLQDTARAFATLFDEIDSDLDALVTKALQALQKKEPGGTSAAARRKYDLQLAADNPNGTCSHCAS